MGNALVIVAMIVCILLILIVLIQNPKGGGLSAAFGGAGTQSFGVQRTTDFLEKATWGLAITLFALCIAGGLFLRSGIGTTQDSTSNVEERLLENPSAQPIIPQLVTPAGIEPVEDNSAN